MLGVAPDGLVAPPGLLDRPSDLSQLCVNAAVGVQATPVRRGGSPLQEKVMTSA